MMRKALVRRGFALAILMAFVLVMGARATLRRQQLIPKPQLTKLRRQRIAPKQRLPRQRLVC